MMVRSTRPLAAPRVADASSAPLSARELKNAARILRAQASAPSASASAAPMLRAEDMRKLKALCARFGAVHTLDVNALAERMAHSAASNFEQLFAAVQKLQRQGALKSPWRAETITDATVQRLAKGDLTPRVARHVQKTARLELLKLFADPVKDKELHALLVRDLKKSFRVDDKTVRAHEIPPEISLREQHLRQQNALLALLYDASLPDALKDAALQKLALCAGKDAVPTLESLAHAEPARAAAVTSAIDAIHKASKMTIVFAAMEVAPYASAGGLGNVMAELPKALAALGHRVIVLSPRHTVIDRNKLEDTGLRLDLHHPHGREGAQLLRDVVEGVEHVFVENGKYFSDGRHGLYADAHGPYGDVAERYDFFSMAVPHAIKALLGDAKPDIVQLNDAHTGPAAAYLKHDPAFHGTKTVMGIHNLGSAYQGRFGADKLHHLGLKDLGVFHPLGPAEFYGDINFFKLGLSKADASIAVSVQYMKEMLERENGEGLEGVLRMLHAEDRLWGNLNGIDTVSWNPATDPALPANYSFADQSGKLACKAALQSFYGLPESASTPVVGVVSRISDPQKGIDDLIGTIERRMQAGEDVQFVVSGQGDPHLCWRLSELQRRYPRNVVFDGDFTKDKERQIVAGSDFFLMPSRFEPCGLPQMYAMRYLTIPVVRAVGGLEESVESWDKDSGTGTGFKFGRHKSIDGGLDAALAWYRGENQQTLLRNCALKDFSWRGSSALEQLAFYRKVMNA